jgi:hypothetical protein
VGAPADPWAEVSRLLARARDEEPAAAAATLEEALRAADRAEAASGTSARGHAFRAEALRLLGRRAEAGRALARAVEARIEDGGAVHAGLVDLLDGLCAHEEVVALAPALARHHPGRRWQFDPLVEEAERRLRLEREAPLSPEGLARLRETVARGLLASPCRHDDDGRPVTAGAAAGMGLDPARVLPWLSALGACCCDCQVASVRGPREPRR